MTTMVTRTTSKMASPPACKEHPNSLRQQDWLQIRSWCCHRDWTWLLSVAIIIIIWNLTSKFPSVPPPSPSNKAHPLWKLWCGVTGQPARSRLRKLTLVGTSTPTSTPASAEVLLGLFLPPLADVSFQQTLMSSTLHKPPAPSRQAQHTLEREAVTPGNPRHQPSPCGGPGLELSIKPAAWQPLFSNWWTYGREWDVMLRFDLYIPWHANLASHKVDQIMCVNICIIHIACIYMFWIWWLIGHLFTNIMTAFCTSLGKRLQVFKGSAHSQRVSDLTAPSRLPYTETLMILQPVSWITVLALFF